MAPPVRTTLLSAVPVLPRPPVVRITPGQVLTSMPPMIPGPRINVVPMPPSAPHVMAPRPPPMVVPTGRMSSFTPRVFFLCQAALEPHSFIYVFIAIIFFLSFLAFVPAPPMPQPPSAAPAPPHHPPPPHEDEPSSKKMKTEDNLMPEEEFLRRNKVC